MTLATNHAIEFSHANTPYLRSTPRKKVIKNSLLLVQQGLVLVKIGKHEYALEPGEAFWVPFDCLTSITYFPNSTVSEVTFSSRLMTPFPTKPGYVQLPAVTEVILNKLVTQKVSDDHRANLYSVIQDEMVSLQPKLVLSNLSAKLSDWSVEEESDLNQEQLLVLSLREANKRLLSGQKIEQVVEDLFAGNQEEFEQLCLLVYGKTL
ncbi:AraC family transcriptional regulator [Vibrio maerlii]|uniref:AraC family transcriptional regulator n=1 Tax=Vibrio maerlii TaxID=2231648 RepID=UPI000E3EADA0|nr:AraC family transcriptional regulator [Vibrio maerlii]